MSHCKDTYDNTNAAADLQVPAFTETGANTFGCLVNGAAWANFGEDYIPSELGGGTLRPNLVSGSFQLNASNGDSVYYATAALTISKKGTNIRQEIMLINVPKSGNMVGVHQLTSSNYLFSYSNFVTGITYSSLIRNPFIVAIKKDSITTYPNHIVSGTFSGTLYNKDQTDSVRIVGGVFDTLVQ